MKKVSIIALSALLVAALSVPAMAKVNLSGAIWTTYWAQQQAGNVGLRNDAGTAWADANVSQAAPQAKAKTFLVAQSMTGNGLQQQNAAAVNGYGFELVADCPVNDWVKAFGDFNVVNAGNLGLVEGYINLAFMKEFNVRAGLQEIPFGMERSLTPRAGQEEVFVSRYTQQANGVLQRTTDVGVQAFGTVASGMIDYNLYVGNGCVRTVAGDTAVSVANNQGTPDINDAKQLGVNVLARPFTGMTFGGSYFAGDVTNTQTVVSGARSRFTAYDLNAGYEYGNIFSITGEYAVSRFDKASLDYQLGVTPGSGQLVNNKVNEYILKAIYTGVADWEFGVRYGVVDPKNVEAEQAAGLSMEKKLSFAAGYRFARAAFLKAEYSWVDTSIDYLNKIDASRGAYAGGNLNPSAEPNDDIFALSLGLQF